MSKNDALITLDKEKIERGVSSRSGVTKKQLEILGIEWPPQKGWKTSVIGQTVTKEDYQQFLESRK